jgi:hypothetical protein
VVDKQQTTIEINGKRYNARTGKLVAETHQQIATATPQQTHHRTPNTTRTPQKPPQHSNQRSKTLMRQSVKRPAPVKASKVSISGITDVAKPAANTSQRNHHAVDPARIARAQSIKQSALVRKFNTNHATSVSPIKQTVSPTITPLAVVPEPATKQPQLVAGKSDALLTAGLRNATSHLQTPPLVSQKRNKSRFATLALSGVAMLLLGAFIVYQNIPNLTLRYAAERAGVDAQLPNYQPSGFSLSRRVNYTPGQIEVSFTSNSDDRAFSIVQKESNWNSETLMANYVSDTSDKVQTYIDKGRTIYLFGDSNATWVNGGVWYEIRGNSQLTSDQLIRIANSLQNKKE